MSTLTSSLLSCLYEQYGESMIVDMTISWALIDEFRPHVSLPCAMLPLRRVTSIVITHPSIKL